MCPILNPAPWMRHLIGFGNDQLQGRQFPARVVFSLEISRGCGGWPPLGGAGPPVQMITITPQTCFPSFPRAQPV
jgi:hypothetical protein